MFAFGLCCIKHPLPLLSNNKKHRKHWKKDILLLVPVTLLVLVPPIPIVVPLFLIFLLIRERGLPPPAGKSLKENSRKFPFCSLWNARGEREAWLVLCKANK
jgi:hypothetical protein